MNTFAANLLMLAGPEERDVCILCKANAQGSTAEPAAVQPLAQWAGPASTDTIGLVTTFAPTTASAALGLLMGTKWASTSLTYSFPTSPEDYAYTGEAEDNFAVANAAQQSAVLKVFGMISAATALTFSAAAPGDGLLRFARSDAPPTAWAYYPDGDNEQGGDVWFNMSNGHFDSPQIGNYAFHAALHEIGHALGLKHPHEAAGAFRSVGGTNNSMAYSVMSYASYAGARATGYTNAYGGYAQSLMINDILALQQLYGANYDHNAGDTTYRWDPVTGEFRIDDVEQGAPASNTIFMTVWDGGGTDTYDFSNYTTNLKISLLPGAWSTVSTNQLAVLGGTKRPPGNIANAKLFENDPRALVENAVGGTGNDKMTGNNAANLLQGGAGNDSLAGGNGADTLDGGTGVDTLNGGSGFDWASYLTSEAGVIAHLSNTTTRSGDAVGDRYLGIEGLIGSHHADTLSGSSAANGLDGADGNDLLMGLSGADALDGGAGDDTLVGGAGADRLTGGSGADVFRFTLTVESGKTATSRDLILDFSDIDDLIDLSLIDANTSASGNQAFTLLAEGATFTAAGQLTYRTTSQADGTEITLVEANINANVAADFSIALVGVLSLSDAQFIL